MRVALVYDRVNKFGGAEQVLLALHTLWPDAPIFTAVYDKHKASWAHVFFVHASFINSVSFLSAGHEWLAWLTPMAFETFSFDEFDVVISVTSAEAKTIITKPPTLHVCYCLTPTRYLWSGNEQYIHNPGFGILSPFVSLIFKILTHTLRRWDRIGSARPDRYVAISHRVEDRIKNYYKRSVDRVIYPPVDTRMFFPSKKHRASTNPSLKPYYLLVSRLVPYKRADIVIDAMNELHKPLIIIGQGSAYKELKKRAGNTVTFIHRYLTDEELALYYQNCRAFVYAGDEDFGIVAAEAQAAGKPVIFYKESGLSEIVVDGKTGKEFEYQTKESLIAAIQSFEAGKTYDEDACVKNAERFDKRNFTDSFHSYIEQTYKEYNQHI